MHRHQPRCLQNEHCSRDAWHHDHQTVTQCRTDLPHTPRRPHSQVRRHRGLLAPCRTASFVSSVAIIAPKSVGQVTVLPRKVMASFTAARTRATKGFFTSVFSPTTARTLSAMLCKQKRFSRDSTKFFAAVSCDIEAAGAAEIVFQPKVS